MIDKSSGLNRDPEYPYTPATLDDLIEWCKWMGEDDYSMARRENAPMVIARYLRYIKRIKERKTGG